MNINIIEFYYNEEISEQRNEQWTEHSLVINLLLFKTYIIYYSAGIF